MPAPRRQFTPEQLETLRNFADHVRAGRRILVFMFTLSGIVGAIATSILAWSTLFPHGTTQ